MISKIITAPCALAGALVLWAFGGTPLLAQDQKANAATPGENSKGQAAGQVSPASPKPSAESSSRAVMPDGAVIDLVGVCEYPSAGHEWWRPDGTPLKSIPGGESPKNFQQRAWLGPMVREFAIRATLAEGAEVTLAWHPPNQSSTCTKSGADKKTTQWLRWVEQLRPDSRTAIRVRYAPEPWKKYAEWKHWATLRGGQRVQSGGALMVMGDPSGQVILTQPYEKNGNTCMVAAFDFDDLPRLDLRFLAIGTDKSERAADQSWQPPTRRVHVLMAKFEKLPLDSIEKFQFQSRPMTPIQFRNISLHAGQKTNFEVHIGAEVEPAAIKMNSREEPRLAEQKNATPHAYSNTANRLCERRLEVTDRRGQPAVRGTGSLVKPQPIKDVELNIVWTGADKYAWNYVVPEIHHGKNGRNTEFPSESVFLQKALKAHAVVGVRVPDTPYEVELIDGRASGYFIDREKNVLWHVSGLDAEFRRMGLISPSSKRVTFSAEGGDIVECLDLDFSNRENAPRVAYEIQGGLP